MLRRLSAVMPDVLAVAGLLLVSAGAWMFAAPLGAAVLGAGLIYASMFGGEPPKRSE